MKLRNVVWSLLIPALAVSAYAADKLSAGKYQATISPAVDSSTADRIEKSLDGIENLTSINVKSKDSTLHFKVKDNAQVDVAQIQAAVKAAAPDSQVGNPMPESSTSGASGATSNPSNSSNPGSPSGSAGSY